MNKIFRVQVPMRHDDALCSSGCGDMMGHEEVTALCKALACTPAVVLQLMRLCLALWQQVAAACHVRMHQRCTARHVELCANLCAQPGPSSLSQSPACWLEDLWLRNAAGLLLSVPSRSGVLCFSQAGLGWAGLHCCWGLELPLEPQQALLQALEV